MRLLYITLDAAFQADAPYLLSLPTLGRLADTGVFCENVQTIYPSLTYPIHASLLTGCYPDKHGIDHNEKYAPRLPAGQRPWHWDAQDIHAETLHQAAFRAGREVASVMWPSSGHNRSVRYNLPEVHALPGENQVLKVLRRGSFAWLLNNERKYRRLRQGTGQPHLDRYSTTIVEHLILRQYNPLSQSSDVEPSARRRRQHMPDVITLHLVDLDVTRHREGVQGDAVRESLIRLDQNVGRLMHALDQAGVLDDTIVAIATDHGQADVTRVVSINDWLQASGLRAHAQTVGMGAYIHCERSELARVQQALEQNREVLRIRQIYGKQDLRRMHAPEHIQLAVDAEDGVEYVDSLDDVPHAANHGFGLDHPAAQCLLWLNGPPFLKAARLRQAHVVDVAPTLAYALGLPLPQAQGRVLLEAFAGEGQS